MEELFYHSWWVALFVLLCYAVYERGVSSVDRKKERMSGRITQLRTEIALAQEMQRDLKEQANAQEDPAWIELTLRRVLGLTPKGAVKIVFEGGD